MFLSLILMFCFHRNGKTNPNYLLYRYTNITPKLANIFPSNKKLTNSSPKKLLNIFLDKFKFNNSILQTIFSLFHLNIFLICVKWSFIFNREGILKSDLLILDLSLIHVFFFNF